MQSNKNSFTPVINRTQITVLGLGGGGCNTIDRLSSLHLSGIRLVAANTDALSLEECRADSHILLGKDLTRGLGSGGDAAIGQKAAEESFRELISAIKGTGILFLTAGLGGGTGSGAIQIAARIAKSLDILTIAIVSTPFSFESGMRTQTARESAARIRPYVDTLITIPNDRLIGLASHDTTLRNAFALADDLLIKGIHSISGMIHPAGMMNVDFSHILRLMREEGGCYISMGTGSGADKAINALKSALRHPLLEEIPIQNATGMVVKFNGNLNLAEIQNTLNYLKENISANAEIITAMEEDNLLKDQVQVMVLVTGIGAIPMLGHENNEVREETHMSSDVIENPQKTMLPGYLPADAAPDELEVPAFVRRGYNQINYSLR